MRKARKVEGLKSENITEESEQKERGLTTAFTSTRGRISSTRKLEVLNNCEYDINTKTTFGKKV